MEKREPHHIVIVGGGAGGLELATSLGNKLGRSGQARITLIDKTRTHLWKPKLHEIAAGSMDLGQHQLNYLAQAHWHHFNFRYGEMVALDREARTVAITATRDEEGNEVTPARTIGYDTLVLSLGSQSNDFGTPGAAQHAIAIDSVAQAAHFHRRLINTYLKAQTQVEPLQHGQLHVCIIGAGATGVELAAELHKTTRELVSYGLDRIDPQHIKLNLIEAADRILPGLPERFSVAASQQLRDLRIAVYTGARVTAVNSDNVVLSSGEILPSALTVWAAGVKAPDFLKEIAGLETNRINQVIVSATLQTTRDPNIFALGDCCSCPWLGRDSKVPPRAQAAHQQASHLYLNLQRRLQGKSLREFQYRDFGSLVSLGKFSTVGNLMGGLVARSFWIEGHFARLMYLSLYKMHEYALHGFTKVALDTLARLITRRTEPPVKLH
jgi:NADH:quinone reductase (non-electrogenic)